MSQQEVHAWQVLSQAEGIITQGSHAWHQCPLTAWGLGLP